ncbi:MAG: phosphoribosylaminoimidazolesuccinocarboxamide synthase [Actinobacteria bacterium]|jgi:phosphoribosylaminoimidazole-succinocarboxamide synthase|nr:phosphoribosylaminoimidazolesuccinocarboxamide synthase [Actinomycetota bacterium]NCG37197.1 phosphoribosylaminoimidazolesuccinocarboxamide synthase [Actinomycetota bacterium]
MTLDLTPALADPFDGLDPDAVSDLGIMMRGKVRDVIDLGDEVALIATDRISAFDHVLGTVPYRGQVLNQLAAWWLERIDDLVPSHIVSIPDPNVTIGRKCRPLPVEVVVRGRLSGSTSTALWTKYAAGERTIYGLDFPDGLQKNDALPEAIITPTTKAKHGAHDEPITEREIVDQGLVEADLWDQVRTIAFAVFARGVTLAARAGLVLVDTKYEFGLDADGMLTIIDEVHTPDSSRFWRASTVESQRAACEEPENLDKEYVRLAYARDGYRGVGAPPPLGQGLAVAAAGIYQETFAALTGTAFEPGAYPAGPRVEAALRNR